MQAVRKILLFANTKHNAKCVAEHIAAIQAGSPHHWFVVNALTNRMVDKIDLEYFDAVGFHYSIHPHERYYCSAELKNKVRDFPGIVFQFLQDEYHRVHLASQAMVDMRTDLLFTIVRPELHHVAYNLPGLKTMKRATVMAGYAPNPVPNPNFIKIQDRPVDLFYRSRVCPLCAGSLGYEKTLIAKEVSRRAPQFGLNVDVSVREEDRLYGKEWITAMSSCRATLGSESGASIWDYDGSIERAIDEAIGMVPDISFEELHEQILKPFDGKLIYSSISPRIFEAAALKTPQILFPGWYNGLIKPDVHFLQLEKDFSNFGDVVRTLRDDNHLERLAEEAYDELIASEKYTERVLSESVHHHLGELFESRSYQAKAGMFADIRFLEIPLVYLPLNGLRNLQAEIRLAFDQLQNVLANPRYKGTQKINRLSELLKRYLTHLAPRLSII